VIEDSGNYKDPIIQVLLAAQFLREKSVCEKLNKYFSGALNHLGEINPGMDKGRD
jgi:hypothetical protein